MSAIHKPAKQALVCSVIQSRFSFKRVLLLLFLFCCLFYCCFVFFFACFYFGNWVSCFCASKKQIVLFYVFLQTHSRQAQVNYIYLLALKFFVLFCVCLKKQKQIFFQLQINFAVAECMYVMCWYLLSSLRKTCL